LVFFGFLEHVRFGRMEFHDLRHRRPPPQWCAGTGPRPRPRTIISYCTAPTREVSRLPHLGGRYGKSRRAAVPWSA
jgi:hypothetical protein